MRWPQIWCRLSGATVHRLQARFLVLPLYSYVQLFVQRTLWRRQSETQTEVDKSQHAKRSSIAALGFVKACEVEFFYLEWCIYSSLSPGESLSCLVGCLAEGACSVAAAAACMAAQTLTSGSSLLRAHPDRPDSAKLNLSSLISSPMAHSNCHPSLLCQRWRDES